MSVRIPKKFHAPKLQLLTREEFLGGPRPMRVGLYLRVSKTKQELQNQRHALVKFCRDHNWHIEAEFFEKHTGTTARDSLEEALRVGEQRRYDLLLFWSLDRLSREGPLKTLLYLERLSRAGIAWKSYTEAFLDSTGIGELLIPIFAWIAKQESHRRGERIRAAFDRIKATGQTRSGRKIGRPARPIPPKILQDALGMRIKGESWSTIAFRLGVPSMSLRRALLKPSSRGIPRKTSKHWHF